MLRAAAKEEPSPTGTRWSFDQDQAQAAGKSGLGKSFDQGSGQEAEGFVVHRYVALIARCGAISLASNSCISLHDAMLI